MLWLKSRCPLLSLDCRLEKVILDKKKVILSPSRKLILHIEFSSNYPKIFGFQMQLLSQASSLPTYFELSVRPYDRLVVKNTSAHSVTCDAGERLPQHGKIKWISPWFTFQVCRNNDFGSVCLSNKQLIVYSFSGKKSLPVVLITKLNLC